MATLTSTPPTIGMQIDAVIAKFDYSLPSTYLYTLVIAASVAFSFCVLNSGGGSSTLGNEVDSLRKIPKPQVKMAQARSMDEPQPKWHILKLTNYVATTGFLLSVLQFASNASMYLNDSTSLLQFLTVWSAFLCYFFGFFGISFIELDDFEEQQDRVQVQVTQVASSTCKTVSVERLVSSESWPFLFGLFSILL